MSDSGSQSPTSEAESTSSNEDVPSQSSGYPDNTDFAAVSIESCRAWLRKWRHPDDWPEDEVVARCLLYRINLSRRRPYSTPANFARCKELLRHPVSELKEILGSHGFVAKKSDKTRIVTRILRAERHERNRARKAFQRRMEAQQLGYNAPSKRATDVYSSDSDAEDDDDDSSSDESFGWTEDKDRYLEVFIDHEGREIEVVADDDDDENDDDDDDSVEGEERGFSQTSSSRAARPTTARKTPAAFPTSHKRCRTQDEETDDDIDPPSPKRMCAASSVATSSSDSGDEEVDHEFAESPLESLSMETSTDMRKRKRNDDVISESDGEERSPKRIHRASSSASSSPRTSGQSEIAKRARRDALKPKSHKKWISRDGSYTPVAEGVAEKKPKISEQVTSSGVAFIPIAEGIARLKPMAREQVTSSGVAFIPVADGIARLAPVSAEAASDNESDESSTLDARSVDTDVEEPGVDEREEQGYEVEDESDEAQAGEQDEIEELEEEEDLESLGSHSQSSFQSPEEVTSLPAPAQKKSKAHDPKTAGKKAFTAEDSNGTPLNTLKRKSAEKLAEEASLPAPATKQSKAHDPKTAGKKSFTAADANEISVLSLKRKRAEKLAESGSDSDEPLIEKRRRVQRPATPGPSNRVSTTSGPSHQAHGDTQTSNPRMGQTLQQRPHSIIINDVDTRVLFENKKIPASISNAMLRIMMGCAEENDVADVYQSRRHLPGYQAYLDGRMMAAEDEDNDWFMAQRVYELREMDAIIVSIGSIFEIGRIEC